MKTPLTIDGGNAVTARALAWLESRHGEAVACAVDAMLYGGLRDAERQALASLDAATVRRMHSNAAEWLLAEGRIRIAGGEQAAAACVLGPDGPPLAAAERSWLERLAATSLRLYDVVAASPGGDLTLHDALDTAAADFVVAAAAVAAALPPGTRVGLRVLEIDGRRELSGAVYAFSRSEGAGVAVQLREAADLFGGGRDDVAKMAGMVIRHSWLTQCYVPAAGAAAPAAAPVRPLVACVPAAAGCGSRDQADCPGKRAHERKGHKAIGDKIEQDLAAALAPKK